MGALTGNGMHDSARDLTEMASMQFAVYGLMNPYTYQRPKITPLPNETGLTVPGGTGVAVVPNGTAPALKQPYLPGQYTEYPAAVQGWAQQALPGWGRGIESGSSADLGNKLDYQFGKAGGNRHNIDRTNGLKAEMDKLGFNDTAENRAYFEQYYNDVLNSSNNIVGDPETASYIENGVTHYYTVTTRESFLMGKYGGAKVTTYWDGNRLLTIKIGSGKQTRYNH